ncbi:MAG: hypothetical protein GTN81_03805 [Proteobacteria bacterium]|nr:hypothetical protein [Pseudomonadota bacterium]
MIVFGRDRDLTACPERPLRLVDALSGREFVASYGGKGAGRALTALRTGTDLSGNFI